MVGGVKWVKWMSRIQRLKLHGWHRLYGDIKDVLSVHMNVPSGMFQNLYSTTQTHTVSTHAPCSPSSTRVSNSPYRWSSSATFAVANIISNCVHSKSHYTLHYTTHERTIRTQFHFNLSSPTTRHYTASLHAQLLCSDGEQYNCRWLCLHTCMID